MSTGSVGEEKAREYVIRHGFKVLATNYTRRPIGELDIVAEKGGILCFIEVKASRHFENSSFTPEIRVHDKKAGKLKRICEVYLREHGLEGRKWRIDVISVILDEEDRVVKLEHFENAVFARKY